METHTYNKSNPHNVTLSQLGITATSSELNILDGVTTTTKELNYMDGVTSNVQTQLNAKASSTSPKISTSIELYGTTPYIDFHFNNDQGDYTSRIIEPTSGNLVVNGTTFTNNGVVSFPSNIIMPNNTSIRAYDKSGSPKSMLFLDYSGNNLHLGNYDSGDSYAHSGQVYINSLYGNIYLRNSVGILSWIKYTGDNFSSILRTT